MFRVLARALGCPPSTAAGCSAQRHGLLTLGACSSSWKAVLSPRRCLATLRALPREEPLETHVFPSRCDKQDRLQPLLPGEPCCWGTDICHVLVAGEPLVQEGRGSHRTCWNPPNRGPSLTQITSASRDMWMKNTDIIVASHVILKLFKWWQK